MKAEVREWARQLHLPVAEKHDSQEICFVPNGDYAAFMSAYLREQGIEEAQTEGEIVDKQGRVLGQHAGTHHFTVGQRRGLRVAAPEPLYVIATEPATHRVVVGPGNELMRRSLTVKAVNWLSIRPPRQALRAQVKIRNKHVPASATLLPTDDEGLVNIQFDDSQRAVTPGQAAVFYDGELVLGGGWIE